MAFNTTYKNAAFFTPKIINPIDRRELPLLSISPIQSGEVRVYWGPGQGAMDLLYNPPIDWPTQGNMLRIPAVLRFFWEATEMDSTVQLAYGPAGAYPYATNLIDRFNLDIVSTNGGIYSSHVHTTTIFNPDGPVYAQAFTTSLSGFTDLAPLSGDLTLTGDQTYHIYAIITEPLSKKTWQSPVGSLHGDLIFGLEGGPGQTGESPAPTFTPGAPPYKTVFNGPNGVGLVALDNKGYSVDNIVYAAAEIRYPPTPFVIPFGYKKQKIVDTAAEQQKVADDVAAMTEDFKGSSYPYFDAYRLPGDGKGITEFWQYTYVDPGTKNWYPTRVVTMWYLRKPHIPITDQQKDDIKAVVPNFKWCVNIIYVDDQYMIDSCLPSSVVTDFVNKIAQACSDLKDQQFIFGGTSASSFQYSGTADMQMEARAVAQQFFGPTSEDVPSSFDPPRPIH